MGEAHGCCKSRPTLALKGRHIAATVKYIALSGLRFGLSHDFRGLHPRLIILRAFSAGSFLTGLLVISAFYWYDCAQSVNFNPSLENVMGIGLHPN